MFLVKRVQKSWIICYLHVCFFVSAWLACLLNFSLASEELTTVIEIKVDLTFEQHLSSEFFIFGFTFTAVPSEAFSVFPFASFVV